MSEPEGFTNKNEAPVAAGTALKKLRAEFDGLATPIETLKRAARCVKEIEALLADGQHLCGFDGEYSGLLQMIDNCLKDEAPLIEAGQKELKNKSNLFMYLFHVLDQRAGKDLKNTPDPKTGLVIPSNVRWFVDAMGGIEGGE